MLYSFYGKYLEILNSIAPMKSGGLIYTGKFLVTVVYRETIAFTVKRFSIFKLIIPSTTCSCHKQRNKLNVKFLLILTLSILSYMQNIIVKNNEFSNKSSMQ